MHINVSQVLRYIPMGACYFLYEMTSIYIGGNNENDKVAFPESVLFHFNIGLLVYKTDLAVHFTDFSFLILSDITTCYIF